jgi:protein SCO1/2
VKPTPVSIAWAALVALPCSVANDARATPDARGGFEVREDERGAVQGREEILEKIDIQQNLDARLPLELEFRDAAGETVRLGDFFGEKPVVLALVYYECPMLCTMVLNGALRAFNTVDELSVGRDFDVVAVSIDPRETPELAAEKQQMYQSRYRREGSKSGWHFLVGEQAAIDTLAEQVGFSYEFDEETDQFAHPSAIMVATPDGHLSQYLLGIDYDPRALRLALVRATDDRIGSLVDRVILYCFNYNPLEGKYSLAIMRLLRVAGVLTVLGLLAFAGTSVWRDRRRASAAPKESTT